MVKKILFITLSNIGDCILTLPALDELKQAFPEARITVMVGPRPQVLFTDNPLIERVIVYDKHALLREKIRLFKELQREGFDMVVDLRNSLFGALLPVRRRTSPFLVIPSQIRHKRDRHLYRIEKLKALPIRQAGKSEKLKGRPDSSGIILHVRQEDEAYIKELLQQRGISQTDTVIAVAPGGRSHTKLWGADRFYQLCAELAKEKDIKIILVGDEGDKETAARIESINPAKILNLCARTTLIQLAALLGKARLLITNDSAVLHMASYLGVPVVALFGPTSDAKYGPWSRGSKVIKKEIRCRPCEKAQCRYQTLECLRLIKVEEVLCQVKMMLEPPQATVQVREKTENFRRILVVRTDRIGDVVLSTPVVTALRKTYPEAYIAMMVTPFTKEIVENNPYLDEVLVYDKEAQHRSWLQSLRFSRSLKEKGFELALILHPTNRVHLLTFFAGIPRRIGYNRKFGFLLTDRIEHLKQQGERHELEYTLDLVRYLGIDPQDKRPVVVVRPEAQDWVRAIFEEAGLSETDTVLAVNPAASCPSKVWPVERFAEVADALAQKYNLKTVIIAGPRDTTLALAMQNRMQLPAVNLAGRVSVAQLIAVLKRSSLFISNDSGPVHIASSVGVPVISIFGRNQKGLSPRRWGPVGSSDRLIHREVGCIECLAHNCTKRFACLRAITVEDVLRVADEILGRHR